MSAGHRYEPAKAALRLGPAAMAAARKNVAAAPPLSAEIRQLIRTVFTTARATRPVDAA